MASCRPPACRACRRSAWISGAFATVKASVTSSSVRMDSYRSLKGLSMWVSGMKPMVWFSAA
jgi:hypothetical protein